MAGYYGFVMGRQAGFVGFDGNSGAEKVELEVLAEFDRVTEWRKDAWNEGDRAYAGNLIEYIECAKIMNEE